MNLEELDVVLGGRSILNPREYNSLALAHIGDAVFEVLVRLTVLTDGNAPVNKLHKKARDIVNAKAQAEMYYRRRMCSAEDAMQNPSLCRKMPI